MGVWMGSVTRLSERGGPGCSSHWDRNGEAQLLLRTGRVGSHPHTIMSEACGVTGTKIPMPLTSWCYSIKAAFLDSHPTQMSLEQVNTLGKGGMLTGCAAHLACRYWINTMTLQLLLLRGNWSSERYARNGWKSWDLSPCLCDLILGQSRTSFVTTSAVVSTRFTWQK